MSDHEAESSEEEAEIEGASEELDDQVNGGKHGDFSEEGSGATDEGADGESDGGEG